MAPKDTRHAPLGLCIPTDGVVIEAVLQVPARPRALVVATRCGANLPEGPGLPDQQVLGEGGLASLFVELLVASEADDPRRRLDVFLLARRLRAAVSVASRLPATSAIPIAYVAEGTSAAGALLASLDDPRVAAVVCRYGRPDLADGILDRVTAPALLITDEIGRGINGAAFERLRCPKALATVGEQAAPAAVDLTLEWLVRHLFGTDETPCTSRRMGASVGHERLHPMRGARAA